jgi:hypothetical protein
MVGDIKLALHAEVGFDVQANHCSDTEIACPIRVVFLPLYVPREQNQTSQKAKPSPEVEVVGVGF